MNNKDIELIKNKAQSVELVSPVLIEISSFNNIVRASKIGSFSIRGVYP